MKIWYLCISWDIVMVSSLNSKYFCDNDDQVCHQGNTDVLKYLQRGKCMAEHVFRRIQAVSLLDCVRECLMTSNCTGINYRRDWHMCDVTWSSGEDLITEVGCDYIKIFYWPKSFAGYCANHDCSSGDRCTGKTNNQYMCELSYCSDLPEFRNATCIEPFGMYRNIGRGNKVKCQGNFAMAGQPFVVCDKTGSWKSKFCCLEKGKHYNDCSEIPSDCPSGIYKIVLENFQIDVYCDMDSGGSTVFQRRIDNATDFYRGWTEYKVGFGNLKKNFWLGNDNLHLITSNMKYTYKLRVVMEDFDGYRKYEKYETFRIEHEALKYMLSIDNYSGDAGDSLMYHNGMQFSTYDQDNDMHENNCAKEFDGAWWYNKCHLSNLNGKYLTGPHNTFANGINWCSWKGYHYSLKSTTMMIQRQNT